MGITLDFGDVGGILPEGTYNVRVQEVSRRESKNGNDMLEMIFQVTGPSHVGMTPTPHRSMLGQTSRWKLQQDLEAITGIRWDKDGMTLDPMDLVGCKCRAVIFHEEYQGKLYAKIQQLLPDEF